MRYVPNLIPDSSKVLPDYFKGNIYKTTKQHQAKNTIFWIIGLFFIFTAIGFIRHPIISLLFGAIGLILIPSGQEFIERKLKFSITLKIKTIAVAILCICAFPLVKYYSKIDKIAANEQKIANQKAAKEKAIADQKEQQRNDSLTFYLNSSNQLAKEHKISEANKQLQYASTFANVKSDIDKLNKEKIGIVAIRTMDLIKAGKYQAALPEIDNLLSIDPSNTDLIYNRAICYSKTGKIQEAVNDLKPLMQAGNINAEKLYNKINPIRKRIVGYETLCCDGTTSYAKGRGACSHHGGVCDWEHPIYEESRKYE